MAPSGKKVLIHETLKQRRTWDLHGKEGWYIGMAPLHYRCYCIYILETQGEHISKTVQYFPHNGAMPAMSSVDADTDTARRLDDALANPTPAAPFTSFSAHTMDAIRQLADFFSATVAPTPTPIPPPRRNCETTQLTMLQRDNDPQALPRVPPTVPPCCPPRPPLEPPPRVEPPSRNQSHRYLLRLRAQTKHTVKTVGEGSVAFQGVLDTAIEKNQRYTQLICGPDKGTLSNDIGRMAQGV